MIFSAALRASLVVSATTPLSARQVFFGFLGLGVQNTLDYRWDKAKLTIDLSQRTADKGTPTGGKMDSVAVSLARWQGTDTIRALHSFIGGSADTIPSSPSVIASTFDPKVYSFVGQSGSQQLAKFHGPQSEYSITNYVDNLGCDAYEAWWTSVRPVATAPWILSMSPTRISQFTPAASAAVVRDHRRPRPEFWSGIAVHDNRCGR